MLLVPLLLLLLVPPMSQVRLLRLRCRRTSTCFTCSNTTLLRKRRQRRPLQRLLRLALNPPLFLLLLSVGMTPVLLPAMLVE